MSPQPQVVRFRSLAGQIGFTAVPAILVGLIWLSIAQMEGGLVPALLVGGFGEFFVVGSGFARVAISSEGVAVHMPTFFSTRRVAWERIAGFEVPEAAWGWNFPLIHLHDGTSVRLSPWAFGRFERRKEAFARWATTVMERARQDALGTPSDAP